MDLDGLLGRTEVAASIIGASGVARVARGCATSRTGTGTYTLTLDRELDAADGVFIGMQRGNTANVNVAVAQTSDSVKTVTTFVGVTATDMDVDVIGLRVASGNQ